VKIDASRYTMFWQNPERYRLRELWKLAPEEPKAGTFASLLTFSRRRGTCFHELRDAEYKGISEFQAIQELKDGGFGNKEIDAAKRMVAAVRDRYPDEKYLAHEVTFEYQIPSSPHVLTGRLDHIFERDGEIHVGDWKTSKHRSKKDMAFLGDKYCGGPQVGFYLLGARTLGFDARRFTYRLVFDRRSGGTTGVQIVERDAPRTGLELKRLERDVHQTCELIEFLKSTFGIQQSWPTIYEPFDGGYAPILGKQMYDNYLPDGFTEKIEHLETMMEDEEGEDAQGD